MVTTSLLQVAFKSFVELYLQKHYCLLQVTTGLAFALAMNINEHQAVLPI